jgi:C1A family cysteine protease
MWPFKRPSISRYSWRPDLPDNRDFLYQAPVTVKIPPVVDLRSLCSPVKDQGNLGSCTANALTSAVEFLELKDKLPEAALSRLFVYYNERAAEHTTSYDSGAALRDGIKTMALYGVCLESLWPYNINVFTRKPTKAAYTQATIHSLVQYSRISALQDMKACLASGFPVVFGFTVYESFESDQVAKTGIVPMPQTNEQVLGGHAVMLVGYSDATQMMLVRNSWGSDWGISGYFQLPYAYISNNNLADDFWTIRRTKSE